MVTDSLTIQHSNVTVANFIVLVIYYLRQGGYVFIGVSLFVC